MLLEQCLPDKQDGGGDDGSHVNCESLMIGKYFHTLVMEEEQKTYICSPTGSWHIEQKLGEVSKQSAAIVK